MKEGKRVITYGTFDLFHQGHYNILKRAKEYGDYLVVGVTGENYDTGRGKLSVKDSLAERIENVEKTGLADEIIVEEYLGQKIGDIIKYGIDYFVIGDDWRGKFDHISNYCEIIYLERTKGISSTQIRQETFDSYDIGIVADMVDDNQIVKEAPVISGFAVKSVYSPDETVLDRFAEKYGIDNKVEDYESLVDCSDIVYIRCALDKREKYIRGALEKSKHVICDPPFVIEEGKQRELFDLAASKGVALIENVKMVYTSVFNQLLWTAQGGLIGDIISLSCSISKYDMNRENFFYDMMATALVPMIKILGDGYNDVSIKKVVDDDGKVGFASMTFDYPKAHAHINVGDKIRVQNQLEIVGTKGTIRMKDIWWRAKYFELDAADKNDVEIYNTNFEGNGFRYLIKAMQTMFVNGKTESMGIFRKESEQIAKIMEMLKDA